MRAIRGAAAPALVLAAAAGGIAAGGSGGAAALLVVPAALVAAWLLRLAASRLALACLAALAGLLVGGVREAALRPPELPSRLEAAQATVLEAPRAERFGWRAFARTGPAHILVRGRGRAPAWQAGSLVLLSGPVRRPDPDDGWLSSRRVAGVVPVQGGPVVGRRGGLPGLVDRVRSRAQEAIAAAMAPEPAALTSGMVLGDDSAMSPALRERLRRTGLGHIVAASGANVALLVGLVLGVCGLAGLARVPRLLVAGGSVAFYAAVCGGGPSILRATVMGLATLAAAVVSRPPARAYAFALALVVTLALDPLAWRDVGWQLSFAAVAGIALLAGPLRERAGRAGLPGPLAEPAALTLAATVATAPVAAAAFGTFSPVSLPANVLVGPLVAPATWLGMVAALAGQAGPALARPFLTLAGLPVAGILAVARGLSALPFAQVGVSALPAALLSLAAACSLGAAVRPAHRRVLLAGAGAALAGLALAAALRPAPSPGAPRPGTARVSFLDIGQGDATLLQSRGESLLVDAGPDAGPVVERLRDAGVKRLGALLVTHAQADHLGGADRVIEEIGANLLIDGRDGVVEREGAEMARTARVHGVPTRRPRAGDIIRVGELSARVLSPAGKPSPGADPNLRSVVLRVDGPGLSVLLGADAESEVLGPLAPGPVDVLKVSHHGSDDPGLAPLLKALGPALAVIPVGSPNPFGHPAPATLEALSAAGVRTLRTDAGGSVSVEAAQGALRVQRWP
ncbi:MAG: ComEC/Rec2 family competence protein [Solirubrobacterales bacterium]